MNAIVFDTLKYFRKLKEAGMPERQAEVQVEAMAELLEERLVTRQDLKELEYRLTIRPGTMMVVAIGVIATLVKVL